ncbi:MAG: hypothetical protein AMXMBFR47_03500 [Planctomycetota bacterium]
MNAIGGVALLVRRSLHQHAFSTTITVLAVALGSGLVVSVFSIQEQALRAFTGGAMGFDAVLGARGSQLQLVLNSIYHLETSPGNIPWKVYEEVRKRRYVAEAIPMAVGDNYFGYRIVGTTSEMLTRTEPDGPHYFHFAAGNVFDPKRREAVIGSVVAERTGLRLGSTFQPYHGLTFDPANPDPEIHDIDYVVVGVLSPTNTPADRVIWIPIEGIFRMDGHVLRGTGKEFRAEAGQEIPDEHKEVSAVLLRFRSPQAGIMLDQEVNKQGRVATLAWPIGQTIADVFNKMGWVNRILELVAYLVIVVAAATILASIYNTINERRREFAILRALGARRRTVFSAIVVEASTIAALGSLLGYGVYAAVLAVAAVVVRQQTGVVLDVLGDGLRHPMIWQMPLIMIGLGALAGVVPALKAYGTDVASNLSPTT